MKKLLSFALVCVMLLALVPQALAAKQELVVSVSSGIESKEWFQEGMKRFNEKHPNVEIVLELHWQRARRALRQPVLGKGLCQERLDYPGERLL